MIRQRRRERGERGKEGKGDHWESKPIPFHPLLVAVVVVWRRSGPLVAVSMMNMLEGKTCIALPKSQNGLNPWGRVTCDLGFWDDNCLMSL